MKQYKTVLEKVDLLEKCICNKCGKEIKSAVGDFNDCSDYQHFWFRWGYVSKFDGEVWEFDLCEDCINEFVQTFSVPANILYRQ